MSADTEVPRQASRLRSVALTGSRLLGALAIGAALALLAWRRCYHQSDIIAFWGAILLLVLGVVGVLLIAVGARRVGHIVVITMLAGLVAASGYWWLVGDTGASRCSWYRPPSGQAVGITTSR